MMDTNLTTNRDLCACTHTRKDSSSDIYTGVLANHLSNISLNL